MKIGERMACVETKLKTIERLIYVVIAGMGIQVGNHFVPLVAASLG